MKIINNEILMDSNFYQNKSFNRLRLALNNIDDALDNVAYNVIDSVTYIKNPNTLADNGGLKKIYNTVIVNTSTEEISGEIGTVRTDFSGYCDVADFMVAETYEEFSLKPGETVIFDINEPYKITGTLPKGIVLAYVSKYSGIK
ncbi:hypothetical protein RZE82_06340 [Mollicutes bacterium LVI A0039]|nr:hypothetical protein RZE82_06340 [Mollicutes bacterium LVI A0039]